MKITVKTVDGNEYNGQYDSGNLLAKDLQETGFATIRVTIAAHGREIQRDKPVTLMKNGVAAIIQHEWE